MNEMTMFHFRGQEIDLAIKARDFDHANKEVERLLCNKKENLILKLCFVDQNYDCPRCGCLATECNDD